MSGLDWELAHAQLEAAARAFREAIEPPPQTRARVLADRARALAVAGTSEERAPLLEVVSFTRGGERYAVPVADTIQVARVAEVVPVPGVPPAIAGIVSFRGEILAVVDLHGERRPCVRRLSDATRVVVLGADEPELGIFADTVEGIRTLRRDAIGGSRGKESLGFTPDATNVLRGDVLLSDPRFFVDQIDERGPR